MLKMRRIIHVTDVAILGPDGETKFVMTFYGVPLSEFTTVPSRGADLVRSSLERRGLGHLRASPFAVWQARTIPTEYRRVRRRAAA